MDDIHEVVVTDERYSNQEKGPVSGGPTLNMNTSIIVGFCH